MEAYQKSRNLLVKVDIKSKYSDISQKKTVLNPKIKEKIDQAIQNELKPIIQNDKEEKFPVNNPENDYEQTEVRVYDTQKGKPKNNKNNNNMSGENNQNNNELQNNDNISINYNNKKQEDNQKTFNDIEYKTNWLKIETKNSKKKIKDNSIGV